MHEHTTHVHKLSLLVSPPHPHPHPHPHPTASSLSLPSSLTVFSLQVIWSRERTGAVLTLNDTVVGDTDHHKLRRYTQGVFDLLLQGVSAQDSDVYACYLETGERQITLSRVAVSSGGVCGGGGIVSVFYIVFVCVYVCMYVCVTVCVCRRV